MPTVYSPPVNTYTPLASITLASATSSVTLTGFSQDYRDLVLVLAGSVTTFAAPFIRLNGDSGSNYSYVEMDDAAGSISNASYTALRAGYLENSSSQLTAQIMDYSATDKHKTALIHSVTDPDGSGFGISQGMLATRWANTDAVTSLEVTNVTFNSGFVLSLYGIEA